MGCAVFAVGFVVEIVLVAMKLAGMLPAWSWVAVTMPVVAPLLLIVAATAIITLID